eukprot:SAG31_NODE_2035_length_6610_cov_9.308555_5_plen_104_part_00
MGRKMAAASTNRFTLTFLEVDTEFYPDTLTTLPRVDQMTFTNPPDDKDAMCSAFIYILRGGQEWRIVDDPSMLEKASGTPLHCGLGHRPSFLHFFVLLPKHSK